MPSMSMIQALNNAMDLKMKDDPTVTAFGEDVGYFGGVFGVTKGLQEKYGSERVFDAPINEGAIVAMAMGMAVNGMRPVAEIQFADYVFPGFDQILSELSRIRYRSANQYTAPVTIRTPCGGGIYGGQTHSMSPEAFFTHIPGLVVMMPSNPYDAKRGRGVPKTKKTHAHQKLNEGVNEFALFWTKVLPTWFQLVSQNQTKNR